MFRIICSAILLLGGLALGLITLIALAEGEYACSAISLPVTTAIIAVAVIVFWEAISPDREEKDDDLT